MTKPKLTIIMPCYNCESTLEEAVESIYTQNLTMPFEVVMVDDGSTDGTKKLIKKLADEHKEIKYVFHKENRGGGAARNTAVENSSADVIFCLDSDDMLGENCLNLMYDTLVENDLDGVTIHKSVKFLDEDINNIQYTTEMGFIDKAILFESLFSKNAECGLYSTFMHTRESFNIIGGYPEDHGFDTQSFAFGFLANGLKARACKDAIYYHRLSSKNNSYYNREYNNGKVNFNWFKIIMQYLYLFNEETKDKILSFDFYSNIVNKNFMIIFHDNFLVEDYLDYLGVNTKEKYFKEIVKKYDKTKYEYYWLYDYTKEPKYLFYAISNGINGTFQYKQLFENFKKTNGDEIDDIFNKLNKNFIRQTLLVRIKNRLNKYFKGQA